MLFRPSSNTFLRLFFWSFLIVPLAAISVGTIYSHSQFNTKVGEAIAQPVPFSHRHHAFELGIDCRYCHTSVETSPFAGLPPTKTCMSCHSVIWTDSPLLQPVRDSWKTGQRLVWNQVNSLPKFVYFNHSIHVKRGVSCNVCHGPVQDMPLTERGQEFTMVWCLKCHRDPASYVAEDKPSSTPSDQVFDLYWKLQAQASLTSQEKGWAKGTGLVANDRHVRDLAKEGVKKVELTDCTVCHR